MDPSNPLTNITLKMLDPSRNCAVAGESAVHFAHFQEDNDSFPIRALRGFILTCNTTTIDSFTDGNLLDWYRYTISSTAKGLDNLIFTVQFSASECREEFCKHLRLEGNADLAGIGVSSRPQSKLTPGLCES
ncbi:hypothetical protein QBC32DRAFT_205176 [Pseudoneurospora amorphoporcata]|uniref:Uncharacterized protein n=1 Tax=Pseudoneurospora amorphoporcata TaxID=241081 RepID=A0AAN6SJQ3_9PEZI|nr:hypothetical protein QBC32DRAFT_205176 [Pseudoneurospora amorphoporcata]